VPCSARIASVLGIAVVMLAMVSSASAALAFKFDHAVARPGEIVTAFERGWPTRPTGVVVYLVPTRLRAASPDPSGAYFLSRPPAHGAIRLGRPNLARTHKLYIAFRVPKVAPGFYTTAFWCSTCAKHGDFFASALWGATTASASPGTVLRVTR
jgi:hypothetical protein